MTDIHINRQTDSDLRQRSKEPKETMESTKEHLKSKAREYQPQAEQLLRKGQHVAQDTYAKMCETCHELKHYPKLMTALLLISAFCLGVGVTAVAGRMGYFVPSTGHFTRDKTAIEAHAALDTLLRNMNSAKGTLKGKYADTADQLHLARETLINVMAAKASGWKEGLSETAENIRNKAYETADGIKEKVQNLYNKPEPTMGDKIRDAVHDARDAVNEQYYNVKGKVLGKEKEVEESKIKSTLHQAENKIKDMLHMQ